MAQRNSNGLTFRQWLDDANFKPAGKPRNLRHEWLSGNDPIARNVSAIKSEMFEDAAPLSKAA